jgi:hypothetical protein
LVATCRAAMCEARLRGNLTVIVVLLGQEHQPGFSVCDNAQRRDCRLTSSEMIVFKEFLAHDNSAREKSELESFPWVTGMGWRATALRNHRAKTCDAA